MNYFNNKRAVEKWKNFAKLVFANRQEKIKDIIKMYYLMAKIFFNICLKSLKKESKPDCTLLLTCGGVYNSTRPVKASKVVMEALKETHSLSGKSIIYKINYRNPSQIIILVRQQPRLFNF